MFLDPARTGLIVLGASEYDHDEDQNRKAFLNAAESINSYFRRSRFGLGLQEETILYLFNDPSPRDQQELAIQEFLNEHSFEDLFIYITGHGFRRDRSQDFYLLLKSSPHQDFQAAIHVERVLQAIQSVTKARVYAIIDACDSGTLHLDNALDLPIDPTDLAYLSNIDEVHLPRGGLVILTSNNPTVVGKVVADDDLEHANINKPIFTHELLKLLTKGQQDGQSFGFTMRNLRDVLEQQVAETLRAVGREDRLPTSKPHLSDQPIIEDRHTRLLSSVAIFPNNHARHSLISRAARRLRVFYNLQRAQFERINELDKAIKQEKELTQRAKSEITTLQESITELSEKLEKTQADHREAIRLLGISDARKKTFKYLSFFLIIVLALVAAVAGIYGTYITLGVATREL